MTSPQSSPLIVIRRVEPTYVLRGLTASERMSLDSILVAVGNNDDARVDALAQTAVDIASPADASVELVHVFSKTRYESAKAELNFDDQSQVTPAEVAKRHASMRKLGDLITEAGMTFECHGSLSSGTTTGERILEIADVVDADLILVGGRRRSPAGKALFGSTAQEVMLTASCPVTFVHEQSHE
ncbi:MAG: universal stress protein UspA related nucleotide-binding protein [uncultured archaeon A07HR60]|nr:MAG: universal stress protein UspA related nucleotide-binding protein [uncultured archaeon A07HR60]